MKMRDVPEPLAGQLFHRIKDPLQLVALLQPFALSLLFINKQWAVTHLHRIGATGDLDHRRLVEMTEKRWGQWWPR